MTPDREERPDRPPADTNDEIAALRARITQLESAAPARPRHRWRSFFAGLLIFLVAVLTPLSAVATWAADVVGDTDRYVSTMAPLADDPDVREAVTRRVTNAVMQNIDLKTLVSDVAPAERPRLEKALEKLSGPLTSGLQGFVQNTVRTFVASDAFESLWTRLNREAHTTVVKALTGSGGGAVKLSDEAVTIDLAPVIERVKQRLVDSGLGIASRIPQVHTDFTVMTSESIGKIKKGFRLLQLLGFWLPVVTLVIAICAVLLAVRKRRALVATGIAVAVGGALLGIGLSAFRAIYLDGLPSGVSQPAAGAVYDALVLFLRTTVRMVITVGVVVALAAWLTGAGRAATRVLAMWRGGIGAVRDAAGVTGGRVGAWTHRAKTWLNWTVVAVAALVMLVWDRPTGVVIVWIALCALISLAVIEFLDDDGAPHMTAAPAG